MGNRLQETQPNQILGKQLKNDRDWLGVVTAAIWKGGPFVLSVVNIREASPSVLHRPQNQKKNFEHFR